MATPLDQLLDSIHPSRTLEEMDRRVDGAINAFPADAAQITDWEAFRLCLMQFMRHVENTALGMTPGRHDVADVDFLWGLCCRILIREYGPNGEKAAFEMARTGNDGGLYAVFKRIGRSIATQFAGTEIQARVQRYWDGLSVEEKHKAGDEYLEKYGGLLPSELTEGSAARIRANLPKVLQEHPKMMQRLRGIGRT